MTASDDLHKGCLTLRVHFPASYPSTSAPVLELEGPCMSDSDRQAAVTELKAMFEPGECMPLRMAMPRKQTLSTG